LIDYEQKFLPSKQVRFEGVGIDTSGIVPHPGLLPFAADVTLWALRKGRAALFEDCGLTKTRQQLEWARHIPGNVLVFAPLCVAEQTVREAQAIDLEMVPHGASGRIQILNYEMLHKVKPDKWDGVVLDESSILKSIDGKTRGLLLEMFQHTPYRLCCTATPAPNDPTEIGNHAHFLGVMTRAEMLGSFFVNRGEGTNAWDLKRHAVEDFYRWLASWSCFLRKPSEIGYPDDGFDLPPLEYHDVVVPVDFSSPGRLFADRLKGVQDRAAVRKMTASARVEKAVEILRSHSCQGIVWCGLNAEHDAVAAALGAECVSIDGSLPTAEKVSRMHRFLAGEVKWLVTKPSIVGHGMNLQQAPLQVFVGLSDSYEDYYQCIRRSWRYPQKQTVHIYIVLSSMEEEIFVNVRRKEAEAARMQDKMVGRIIEYEKAEITGGKQVAPYHEERVTGEGWEMWRGDCVSVMGQMPAASVDLSVFSPPFADLFVYSASERDMGNSRNLYEFLRHFRYFIKELRRAMKPGRIVACHCQQIALQKAKHGVIGVRDFRGALIRAFERGDFIYHGEITIDKNPQAAAIRTRTKGLGFAQLEKDASWMRPAFADYIILLRTPGENEIEVVPDCTRDEWIEWASPVWYHCGMGKTLQTSEARDSDDEKHICALQLPTIERCVRLWSNRGDVVLSPFAGIASEGHEAIMNGRRFVGVELKESYFRTACKNLERAVAKKSTGRLF